MLKVPRHVCPTASCAALDVSVLQQSELPPDVSVLQQSLDVFFTTFRSTAVIGQTPPGTVHTPVEQSHTCPLSRDSASCCRTYKRPEAAQAAVG
jgi:hypothetical protein